MPLRVTSEGPPVPRRGIVQRTRPWRASKAHEPASSPPLLPAPPDTDDMVLLMPALAPPPPLRLDKLFTLETAALASTLIDPSPSLTSASSATIDAAVAAAEDDDADEEAETRLEICPGPTAKVTSMASLAEGPLLLPPMRVDLEVSRISKVHSRPLVSLTIERDALTVNGTWSKPTLPIFEATLPPVAFSMAMLASSKSPSGGTKLSTPSLTHRLCLTHGWKAGARMLLVDETGLGCSASVKSGVPESLALQPIETASEGGSPPTSRPLRSTTQDSDSTMST